MSITAPERAKLFAEWSRELNSDVICLWNFPSPIPTIILNSHAAIKDAFLAPETAEPLAGRPRVDFGKLINPEDSGE